jgi:1,4-dihydroxy-2-naphthoyl-CoA synthase
MPDRSPAEIRDSLEATRQDLEYSLVDLRGKINELTNWRQQIRNNRKAVVVSAAVAGFVIGGGVAAAFGVFRRR